MDSFKRMFGGLALALFAAVLFSMPVAHAATPVQGQVNGGAYYTLKVNKNGDLVGPGVADGTNEIVGSINLADGTSTALFASQGTGYRGCLVWLDIAGVAATTEVSAAVKDGSTTKFTFNVPAAMVGRTIVLARPLCSTSATAINVQLSGVPTGSVRVNAGGYKVPN